jgi:hypothetical protein
MFTLQRWHVAVFSYLFGVASFIGMQVILAIALNPSLGANSAFVLVNSTIWPPVLTRLALRPRMTSLPETGFCFSMSNLCLQMCLVFVHIGFSGLAVVRYQMMCLGVAFFSVVLAQSLREPYANREEPLRDVRVVRQSRQGLRGETVKVAEDNTDDCPICLDTLRGEASVLRLPCGHLFHTKCAQRWARRERGCACCRA